MTFKRLHRTTTQESSDFESDFELDFESDFESNFESDFESDFESNFVLVECSIWPPFASMSLMCIALSISPPRLQPASAET